jgi:hypothetical protein
MTKTAEDIIEGMRVHHGAIVIATAKDALHEFAAQEVEAYRDRLRKEVQVVKDAEYNIYKDLALEKCLKIIDSVK